MTSERDLLLYSLPPEGGADWDEFEAAFLGKKADCPPTADLIEAALGQPPESLRVHLAACDACRAWFDAYRRGLEEAGGEPEPGAPRGSLLEAFADGFETREASPLPPALAPTEAAPAAAGFASPSESGSIVLTGIFTMLLEGRTEEALQLLRPYLPDVLEAVGLDPSLADRLWGFIRQRLRGEPRSSPGSGPQWLREFARESLQFDDLPYRPNPDDWKPVIARCALRTVGNSPEEPEEVRRFLQAAIEHGVANSANLGLFRSAHPSRAGISEEECRWVMKKVRAKEKRVSRLFGLN
jgi:hypothetical protein